MYDVVLADRVKRGKRGKEMEDRNIIPVPGPSDSWVANLVHDIYPFPDEAVLGGWR